MKPLSVVAGCLFFSIALFGGPSVELLTPLPSSQNPKIIVLHDGRPLQNAEVEVSSAKGKKLASRLTDAQGVVVIPPLPAGRYTVAATAPGRLQACLILDISKQRNKKRSEFPMQLQVGPPSLSESIVAAEADAAPERIPEFTGTVVDPSGAAISNTTISIYLRGTNGRNRVSSVLTGAMGHFTARLSNGAYTAVFQAQGFATKIQTFEVTGNGEQKDLRVRLDVGPIT